MLREIETVRWTRKKSSPPGVAITSRPLARLQFWCHSIIHDTKYFSLLDWLVVCPPCGPVICIPPLPVGALKEDGGFVGIFPLGAEQARSGTRHGDGKIISLIPFKQVCSRSPANLRGEAVRSALTVENVRCRIVHGVWATLSFVENAPCLRALHMHPQLVHWQVRLHRYRRTELIPMIALGASVQEREQP